MHNFIEEKMDLNFYNSAGSSQLQKLKYLFKYGELSSLNSLGKYIFESFKSRDKQSYFYLRYALHIGYICVTSVLLYFILFYCKYFLYADIPYTGNYEIYILLH